MSFRYVALCYSQEFAFDLYLKEESTRSNSIIICLFVINGD